jgi:hypothetical protein
MFSTLRNRFGIPGVISVIALVFAMLGGAYAAQSSDNGKATASAKAKKGPRGPKGPKGDTGPAGPQGPAGPAGAKGDAGANGANGSNGAAGPTGPQGAKGATGAAGAAGATGPEGSPWTDLGVLPKGETETGTWTAEVPASTGAIEVHVPISFPIPLSEGKEGSSFFFTAEKVASEEFTNGCKWEQGNTDAQPESTVPGTLCIFEYIGEGAEFSFFKAPGDEFAGGYSSPGSIMFMERGAVSGQTFSAGTWAVSGP